MAFKIDLDLWIVLDGKNPDFFISSPEHEVLMVSFWDQSMFVVHHASSVVCRQHFALKAFSS